MAEGADSMAVPAVTNGENGSPAPVLRDPATGQFAPGTAPGPGRRSARERFRSIFFQEVSDDRLRGIVRRLLQAALQGQWRAVETVLAYCLGRPVSTIEFDDGDGELRIIRTPVRGPTAPQDAPGGPMLGVQDPPPAPGAPETGPQAAPGGQAAPQPAPSSTIPDPAGPTGGVIGGAA